MLARMASEIVHCVMGGSIVLAVYWRWDLAMMHSRCVTGCAPVAVDLGLVPEPLRTIITAEILDELPEDVRDDLHAEQEWDGEDEDITPVVEVSDLDDG